MSSYYNIGSCYFVLLFLCAANDTHVRMVDSLRPAPELSFAVCEYGCQAGIHVTASRNLKEYNGYKGCWEDDAHLLSRIQHKPLVALCKPIR